MIKSLSGEWKYRIGKGAWTQISVPFSALAVGHSECMRFFDLEKNAPVVLLKFEGITYKGKIYLNDTLLGTTLPYSEYIFDITSVAKDKNNLLLVEIEDIDTAFGPSEGWENYGGIIRDVSIIYKEKNYIKDVHFTKMLINQYTDAQYSVDVSATKTLSYRASLFYDGNLVDTYISCKKETRTIENIALWSPSNPALYDLKVELLDNGTVIDEYKARVGFCELKCDKNRFVLNGEDIFLVGVCRHEMHGRDTGHTVSYNDIYNDMKMIKDTGCNFVRLVHYPHNKVTLDIADELGLLVCEEPGMWQADVKNKELTSECLEVLRRVVLRDRNHPSIAFWLAFNECDFDEEFLKQAVAVCRENDPSRLVSGANNMPNDETKKYYNLCQLDFYTMHPYSETFDMAKKASEVLSDKPLMFTEWGGYYVYDNPHLLTDFLMSMHELYKSNALGGTCLWYWAEINDYNRGGSACVDGTLKEALVDFERKPNLIYYAFCDAIKNMKKSSAPTELYSSKKHIDFVGTPVKCQSAPSYDAVLSCAKEPLKTRLAKTRKKQIAVGPILQDEEFKGISKIPFLVDENELVFEVNAPSQKISILGMTALNYGYPVLGGYGEDALKITIEYFDQKTEKYIAKNGVDLTIAYTSVGSSRINPIAENTKRALSFSYDKNFEEYIINLLEIKANGKEISKVYLKALNKNYKVLIYGIFI